MRSLKLTARPRSPSKEKVGPSRLTDTLQSILICESPVIRSVVCVISQLTRHDDGDSTTPMPYHLDMGNQTSQPPGEGTYKIILDANGNIKNIPGAPGVDYESADHVLHLDVHNWREGTRSFHLGIETLTPETDFDCELDWTKDVLKFSFKLHPGYQGGRPELLHRIQRLFQDDNLLGITQKYLGREAMAEVLTEMRKSHRKKNNWRAAVIRYDCSTSWLRRSEAASIAYYKLVVDKYETAMFAVDTNNEEYKAVVGSKAVQAHCTYHHEGNGADHS